MANVLDVVLVACVIVLSTGLAGTTWLSLRRTGNRRLLFVTGAFGAFMVQGVLMALSLFLVAELVPVSTVLLFTDLAVLLLLYLSLIIK